MQHQVCVNEHQSNHYYVEINNATQQQRCINKKTDYCCITRPQCRLAPWSTQTNSMPVPSLYLPACFEDYLTKEHCKFQVNIVVDLWSRWLKSTNQIVQYLLTKLTVKLFEKVTQKHEAIRLIHKPHLSVAYTDAD